MSIAHSALIPAVATLQSAAATPEARAQAAGTAYTVVLPLLTRHCEELLAAVAPAHWMAGEDLASATLLRFVLDVAQSRACRSNSVAGILAFLRRAAFYDLLDTREARAERETGVRGLLTARLDDSALAMLTCEPDASESCDADDAFWRRYRLAVQHLPPAEQRVWILCIEQELPMAEVARYLGVNRTTVWRQVQAAASRLRAGLKSELPAWRRRSLGYNRPVAPRRAR